MPRRILEERNIRKLCKTSGGSVFVTLPIEMVRELKWRKDQKVVVTKKGKILTIKDYKPR